jgi:predicted metal-dependent phosphoesterase TrpH
MKYFPEAYRSIKAKHRAYWKEITAQKRKRHRRAIIRAARNIRAEGIELNYYQIRKWIGAGRYLTNREINSVLDSITY